jgi:hypothetical protein
MSNYEKQKVENVAVMLLFIYEIHECPEFNFKEF